MTTPSASSGSSTGLSNLYIPAVASTFLSESNEQQRRQKLLSNRSNGDGETRSNEGLRKVVLETSVLNGANGSSLVELGHTKVLCKVDCPLTDSNASVVDVGVVQCKVVFAPFFGRVQNQANSLLPLSSDGGAGGRTGGGGGMNPLRKANTLQEVDMETRIRDALLPSLDLSLYPKCVLKVQLTVLQDDGSALSACIVAASLAMADARIELYDLVTSCAVVSIAGGGKNTCAGTTPTIVADPDRDEEETADATVVLAMMPAWKDVTLWQQQGPTDGTQMIDLCRDGCRTVHRLMRQCLIDQATKAKTKGEKQV